MFIFNYRKLSLRSLRILCVSAVKHQALQRQKQFSVTVEDCVISLSGITRTRFSGYDLSTPFRGTPNVGGKCKQTFDEDSTSFRGFVNPHLFLIVIEKSIYTKHLSLKQ